MFSEGSCETSGLAMREEGTRNHTLRLWLNTLSISYVYWTVHHCNIWRIRDQLDVTCYYALFHFFYAQQVSDINTSIIRSLQLIYWITTLVVCSCFDVCWSFGVVGLEWYPCGRLVSVYPQPDVRTLVFGRRNFRSSQFLHNWSWKPWPTTSL